MATNLQALSDSILAGEGLYTVADAAFYAKMPSRTLADWFFGRKDKNPYRHAKFADLADRFITFDEFIEALAIRSLRDRNFTLREILDALAFAEDRLGIPHLFSHPEHRIVTDRTKTLHVFLANETHPIQVSGKYGKGQQSVNILVQEYLSPVEFDDHKKAVGYRPAQFFGHTIAMIPKISFGEPIIEEVSYSVQTLAEAAEAEGSISRAADLYEIDKNSVKAAVKYWAELEDARKRKAA